MGNTVILRHADGLYSLYGHLDFFAYGLGVGDGVAQGQFLGNMGNSGYPRRTATLTHVHFEIKRSPTISDGDGAPRYVGYTPGHPDLCGYIDPRHLVEGIAPEPYGPEAISVVAPESADVRGCPGEVYLDSKATPVLARIAAGSSWIASRRAFAEGREWYFIDLPSTRDPAAESRFPARGPTGGWIDAGAIEPDLRAVVMAVSARRAVLRSCPDGACPPIARAFRGQHLADVGPPLPGPGCPGGWRPVDLPEDAAGAEGWICGAAIQTTSLKDLVASRRFRE